MAVTSLIEVALRNSVCQKITEALNVDTWLRHPPEFFKWSSLEIAAIKKATDQAKRAEYSKLSNVDKIALDDLAFPNGLPPTIKHRKLAQHRQSKIVVHDDQIIAQLTMHFWKRLFSEQYEKTLWKRCLKNVFPNKLISRQAISAKLEVIYGTRNRLAHHEPVYGLRLTETLEAINFFLMNIGSRRPSRETAFAKLIQPQYDILLGQVAVFQHTFERLCR